MNYIFVRDGVEEAVDLEKWGWGVVYKDGTEFKQFGDDGVFHQFKEIVQENVEMFTMYRTDDSINLKNRIDMPMSEGMQIFHFYRNLILEQGSPEERRVKVYVFGWKRDGVASYNYILPDDRLIVADRDIAGLPNYEL